MFAPFDFAWFAVYTAIGISCLAFFVFALKHWRIEDYRCPRCNFLVTAEDVRHYGYICPDCRTDWRVHPLKNDDGEQVEDEIPDEGRESETNQSGRSRKRLVR